MVSPRALSQGQHFFIYIILDLPSIPQSTNEIFADDTKLYQAKERPLIDQANLQKSIDDMVG